MIKKILITAGPTREMLDPVRFLSNLSTGEMGYILAKTAKARRYKVTLISGPTALKPPRGVRFVSVESAKDLKRACRIHFPKHDLLIMTSAVCDFTAATRHAQKIHRTRTHRLMLKQTPDIVAALAKRKGKRLVIGFCLETENWLRNAHRKVRRKSLDGIVANYYGKGHNPFGKNRLTAALMDARGKYKILKNHSKSLLAVKVLGWVRDLYHGVNNFSER